MCLLCHHWLRIRAGSGVQMTPLSIGRYLTGPNSKHDIAHQWLHLGPNYKGHFKLSELHDYKLPEID